MLHLCLIGLEIPKLGCWKMSEQYSFLFVVFVELSFMPFGCCFKGDAPSLYHAMCSCLFMPLPHIRWPQALSFIKISLAICFGSVCLLLLASVVFVTVSADLVLYT